MHPIIWILLFASPTFKMITCFNPSNDSRKGRSKLTISLQAYCSFIRHLIVIKIKIVRGKKLRFLFVFAYFLKFLNLS